MYECVSLRVRLEDELNDHHHESSGQCGEGMQEDVSCLSELVFFSFLFKKKSLFLFCDVLFTSFAVA